MRALAECIVRSRVHSIIVATVCSAVPLLFWVSAAAVGLVILRHGLRYSVPVLLWAFLPALFWAAYNGPTAFFCLVGVTVLACCLRATVSWLYTSLLFVPISFLSLV